MVAKFAVQTNMLRGRDLAEKFASAAAFGFAGVEVNVGPDFDLGERLLEVRAAAQASGLPVCAICTHSINDVLLPDPAERAARFAGLTALLTQADELGAAGVVAVPFRPPVAYPGQSWDEIADRAVGAFQEWAVTLPDGRAQAFLEPLNRYEATFLNRVGQGVELAVRIGHPRVSALADLFHMNIEESDLGAPIRAAGTRLGHVHLGDNNRLEPGKGCLDFLTPFAALKAIGYDGFQTIETRLSGDPATVLPASVAFLQGRWDAA